MRQVSLADQNNPQEESRPVKPGSIVCKVGVLYRLFLLLPGAGFLNKVKCRNCPWVQKLGAMSCSEPYPWHTHMI